MGRGLRPRHHQHDDASQGVDVEGRRPAGTAGHELSVVPGSQELLVSTEGGVWRFDRASTTFRPDPDLHGLHHVKSAVLHPATGRLAYTQADTPEWWTTRIRFRRPDEIVTLDGEHIYKVRWLPGQ
jgi:hypothetical protein